MPRPETGATTDRTRLPARVTEADLARARDLVDRVLTVWSGRVVGQQRLRTTLLVGLMTGGHVLLESVPGLAKTTAAETLAHAVGGTFSRIQCTPDLLPSDIIGTQVYDAAHGTFTTQLGPVHANFVLLDEINRSSAKTQSAMLEAMQEHQTSIGGELHRLPEPFMVMATQNPIEEEGTYVLPHAQMDRFLLKEVLDYPGPEEEVEILDRIDAGVLGSEAAPPGPVLGIEDVAAIQAITRRVYVDASVKRYIVHLVGATRRAASVIGPELGRYVEFGASPRASITLQQSARALALMAGRAYVIPEDVQHLKHAVLRHRIILGFEATADGISPEQLIDALFRAVPAP